MRNARLDFPRVHAKLPVKICGPNGDCMHATTVDISRSGLQLEFDLASGLAVFPKGRIAPGDPLQLSLQLPTSEPSTVDVQSQVIYANRVAGEEFRMGLRDTDSAGDGYQSLVTYIAECML